MIVRNVRDIPPDDKHSLEHILGEPLRDDQRVCIMVIAPDTAPNEQTRRAALERLHQLLDQAERRAEALGITPEEADAAVEDAMQHVRGRG